MLNANPNQTVLNYGYNHTAIAVYNHDLAELVIVTNHDRGFAVAERLPYIMTGDVHNTPVFNTLTVVETIPEAGYACSVQLPIDGDCSGCMYLTGETLLPCAVNPMDYKLGCRNYESTGVINTPKEYKLQDYARYGARNKSGMGAKLQDCAFDTRNKSGMGTNKVLINKYLLAGLLITQTVLVGVVVNNVFTSQSPTHQERLR